MPTNDSLAQLLTQDLHEHPRVLRLSERAREIYLDLLSHASPDGSVVTLRVHRWMQERYHVRALAELVRANLFHSESIDEHWITLPVTLDRSEALARGDVP